MSKHEKFDYVLNVGDELDMTSQSRWVKNTKTEFAETLDQERSLAQNILYDGGFDTTNVINKYFDQPQPNNVWYSWQNWQINNIVTVVDGVCHFEVLALGTAKNTWDIQLIQKGFPLIQGHTYRLSFDVKADANRYFGLFLGENGGLWTSLIGYEKYTQYATTEWKTITIDFVALVVFPNHKLSFELGAEQVVTHFDNITLLDMGFPSIAVVGSALNGWDVDIDMQTTDGIKYTLVNYPLTAGEAKFRQDKTWNVNWGNETFPSGIAYQDGPNIKIPVLGNYDIIFNKFDDEIELVLPDDFNEELKEYSFPDNVTSLVFGRFYNQDIKINCLPPKLKYLVLGDCFNKSVIVGSLPNTLISLTFGKSYNKELELGVLPESLLYLKLGEKYNKELMTNVLPSSLITLEFDEFSCFNKKIKKSILSPNIKKIVFGESYNYRLKPNVLPPALKYLILGKNFTYIILIYVIKNLQFYF